MKVKHLLSLLRNVDPESNVLVRLGGSIFSTDNLEEHEDYNFDYEGEVFILALED